MSFKFVSSQIHIHFVEAGLGIDHQFLLRLKKGLAKSVMIKKSEQKNGNFYSQSVNKTLTGVQPFPNFFFHF